MPAHLPLPLSHRHCFRESGLALLGVIFFLSMATTAYVLYSLNANELKIEREKISIQALSEAKSALIAWAVSNPSQPGMLPYPDRNNDGNYDGKSDCHTTTLDGNYDKLLGRLPWQSADNGSCVNSSFISGMGSDIRDGSGTPLWYAVSRNLVYPYIDNTFPVINPGMINSPNTATAPYQRNGGITAYPWLTVYDKTGQLVSDRVAAVIIAPGAGMGDQDRSADAPDATEYLDTYTLTAGGGAKSNQTYAFPDEDFYMGEDARNISSADATYVRPYEFNDRLVYITIDELMAAVEKRAAAEAKAALIKYKAANGYFPRPASVGVGEYFGNSSLLEGFLPTQETSQAAAACSVSYSTANSSSSSCPFSSITSVQFRRTTGTFTSTTGTGCTRINSNTTCQCTSAVTSTARCNGAGGRRFTCNSAGSCFTTGTLPGTYTFNGAFSYASGTPTTIRPNVFSGSSICMGCGSNTIICSSTSLPYPLNATFSYTPKPASDAAVLANYFAVLSLTTSGSGNITTAANFNDVSVGMSVIGTGIPPNTTVTSIPNSTTVGLSNQATVDGNSMIFFGAFGNFPSWFVTNYWRDYLYYAVSSNCVSGQNCTAPNLTVGTKSNVQALLISTSNPIIAPSPFSSKGSSQTQPSCNTNDYLDSGANTNLDTIFDKTSMPRGNSYNDQIIIVAP